jgi:hypothetical protein
MSGFTLGDAMPLVSVTGDGVGVQSPSYDPKTGQMTITSDDGDTIVNIGPDEDEDDEDKFYDNLAETLPGGALSGVAERLLTDIAADEASRAGWLDTRSQGLSLLALEIQNQRNDSTSTAAPLEGMSSVVAPMLLSEVLRAQATARGELLPADGPVKVMDESTAESPERDALANALEKDMNTFLTRVCTEYYPDTDRMLFYACFGGSGFKKVFRDPVRRRPVSESVDAADLIINAGATDLTNARRITHRIGMRQSMVKRMMLAGAYRDIALGMPSEQPTEIEQREAEIAGIEIRPSQPHDQNHTIYEVLCEEDFGEGPEGLPLPYKVTIDRDSRQVLEVRRNWRDGDEMYTAREMYVRYPYIDAISIYGIGLLHLLGNNNKALTAAEREMLDAGMFSCFPGFLYSSAVSRQPTSDIRIAPGSGMKIDSATGSIKDAVMPLPYEPPSPVLLQMAQWLEKSSKELAGSAELQVGEGQANMPVGTVMAMLDQATKPLSAVHKRFHAAQAKEFQLLVDLLREDPEAFWRDGRRGIYAWDKETFIQALDAYEIAPVSDPNEPTRTHRLMKAQALKQLSQMSPALYDVKAIDSYILRLLGFANPTQFFNNSPAAPPPPPPEVLVANIKAQSEQAELKQKNTDSQRKLVEAQINAQAKERMHQGDLGLEHKRLGAEIASDALAHQQADKHHNMEMGAQMVTDGLQHGREMLSMHHQNVQDAAGLAQQAAESQQAAVNSAADRNAAQQAQQAKAKGKGE